MYLNRFNLLKDNPVPLPETLISAKSDKAARLENCCLKDPVVIDNSLRFPMAGGHCHNSICMRNHTMAWKNKLTSRQKKALTSLR